MTFHFITAASNNTGSFIQLQAPAREQIPRDKKEIAVTGNDGEKKCMDSRNGKRTRRDERGSGVAAVSVLRRSSDSIPTPGNPVSAQEQLATVVLKWIEHYHKYKHVGCMM